MTSPQRFIVIAWPDDHDEDIATHACDIQDVLLDMGCPQVVAPLPPALHAQIEEALKGYEGL